MKVKNVLNKIVKKLKKARTRDIEEAREINYDTLNKIRVLNNAITLLNNNVNIDYVFDYMLLKGSD